MSDDNLTRLVHDLAAIESIKQLKGRYFRLMDTKQWDALEGVFAPDAVFDARDAVRDGSGEDTLDQVLGEEWLNTGSATIRAFIRNALLTMRSVHFGHMPEIEITGEDSARGIWPMKDQVETIENGRIVRRLRGAGHYHETYQKIDGDWKIKTSRLTRLHVTIETFA